MPLATGHQLDPGMLTTMLWACQPSRQFFCLPIQSMSHQSGYMDTMAGWGKDLARSYTISAPLPFSVKPIFSLQEANRLAGHYLSCLNQRWMFAAWSLIAARRMCIITLCTVNGFGLHFPIHLRSLQPVVFLLILTCSYSQSQKVCLLWKKKGSCFSICMWMLVGKGRLALPDQIQLFLWPWGMSVTQSCRHLPLSFRCLSTLWPPK